MQTDIHTGTHKEEYVTTGILTILGCRRVYQFFGHRSQKLTLTEGEWALAGRM